MSTTGNPGVVPAQSTTALTAAVSGVHSTLPSQRLPCTTVVVSASPASSLCNTARARSRLQRVGEGPELIRTEQARRRQRTVDAVPELFLVNDGQARSRPVERRHAPHDVVEQQLQRLGVRHGAARVDAGGEAFEYPVARRTGGDRFGNDATPTGRRDPEHGLGRGPALAERIDTRGARARP